MSIHQRCSRNEWFSFRAGIALFLGASASILLGTTSSASSPARPTSDLVDGGNPQQVGWQCQTEEEDVNIDAAGIWRIDVGCDIGYSVYGGSCEAMCDLSGSNGCADVQYITQSIPSFSNFYRCQAYVQELVDDGSWQWIRARAICC